MTVLETIQDNLRNTGFDPNSQEFTQHLDSSELSRFFAKYRSEFFLPKVGNIQPEGKTSDRPDDDVIYLVSNSLGLLNKRTKKLIEEELDVWSKKGVFGHFSHDFQRPWKDIDETSLPMMAKVIGAKVLETSIMCTLTANLHFLLNAFYKPTSQKYKILMEDKAFPSDHYAIISQVKQHGFNPDTDIIYLKPRKGEYLIREEDIFNAIEDENLALILLPGVQYYTGQVFPMEEITKLGQSRGVKVGFDLAHAVGNIPLELNKWNVDFACWCTYKYLASGPGNIGGLFVHERYATASEMNRLLGWWAHNPDTRFKMSNQLDLSPGAAGFQLSNPSVTNVVALQGTLSIYNEFDMQMFREQSLLLTDYLELLIKSNSKLNSKIDIMTPEDSTRRGCQLSLLLIEEDVDLVRVYNELLHHGVMTDERHPNCIRVAPYPLINSFQEVREFVAILEKVLIN